jgi:hypothetical protein
MRDDEHNWGNSNKCSVCGMLPNKKTLELFNTIKIGMISNEVLAFLGNPKTTISDTEMYNIMPNVIGTSFSGGGESWLYRKNGIKFIAHFKHGRVSNIELYPKSK